MSKLFSDKFMYVNTNYHKNELEQFINLTNDISNQLALDSSEFSNYARKLFFSPSYNKLFFEAINWSNNVGKFKDDNILNNPLIQNILKEEPYEKIKNISYLFSYIVNPSVEGFTMGTLISEYDFTDHDQNLGNESYYSEKYVDVKHSGWNWVVHKSGMSLGHITKNTITQGFQFRTKLVDESGDKKLPRIGLINENNSEIFYNNRYDVQPEHKNLINYYIDDTVDNDDIDQSNLYQIRINPDNNVDVVKNNNVIKTYNVNAWETAVRYYIGIYIPTSNSGSNCRFYDMDWIDNTGNTIKDSSNNDICSITPYPRNYGQVKYGMFNERRYQITTRHEHDNGNTRFPFVNGTNINYDGTEIVTLASYFPSQDTYLSNNPNAPFPTQGDANMEGKIWVPHFMRFKYNESNNKWEEIESARFYIVNKNLEFDIYYNSVHSSSSVYITNNLKYITYGNQAGGTNNIFLHLLEYDENDKKYNVIKTFTGNYWYITYAIRTVVSEDGKRVAFGFRTSRHNGSIGFAIYEKQDDGEYKPLIIMRDFGRNDFHQTYGSHSEWGRNWHDLDDHWHFKFDSGINFGSNDDLTIITISERYKPSTNGMSNRSFVFKIDKTYDEISQMEPNLTSINPDTASSNWENITNSYDWWNLTENHTHPDLSSFVRVFKGTRPWYEGKGILKRIGTLPMDKPFAKSYHDGPRMFIAHEGYGSCAGINKNGDKALYVIGGNYECVILVNNEWTFAQEAFASSHAQTSVRFDKTGNRFAIFNHGYASHVDVYEWNGVYWHRIAHIETQGQYNAREMAGQASDARLSGDGKVLYMGVSYGKLVYTDELDARGHTMDNNATGYKRKGYFRCYKISDKPSPIYYDVSGNESLRGYILNHDVVFKKHVEKNFSFKSSDHVTGGNRGTGGYWVSTTYLSQSDNIQGVAGIRFKMLYRYSGIGFYPYGAQHITRDKAYGDDYDSFDLRNYTFNETDNQHHFTYYFRYGYQVGYKNHSTNTNYGPINIPNQDGSDYYNTEYQFRINKQGRVEIVINKEIVHTSDETFGSIWDQFDKYFIYLTGGAASDLGSFAFVDHSGNILKWLSKSPEIIGKSLNSESVGSFLTTTGSDFTSMRNLAESTAINEDGSVIAFDYKKTNYEKKVFVYELSNNEWIQRGNTLNQSESNENFGFRLKLSNDGNKLAIGSPNNNYDTGNIKIYEYYDNLWNLKTEITGKDNYSYMGYSFDLNDDFNIIVTGSKYGDVNKKGLVQIFEITEDSHNQIGSDLIGINNGDNFGNCVSINKNGDVIAIGAPHIPPSSEFYTESSTRDRKKMIKDYGSDIGKGYVSIYKYIDNTWQKDTDISDNKNGTGFGYCVDMNNDGTIIGIGAPFDTNKYTYDYFTSYQEEQRKHFGKICVYKNEENKWLRHGGEIINSNNPNDPNYGGYTTKLNNYWGFSYTYPLSYIGYKFNLSSDGNSIVYFFNNSTELHGVGFVQYTGSHWVSPYYNGVWSLGMYKNINFDIINNSVDKILEIDSLNLSNDGKKIVIGKPYTTHYRDTQVPMNNPHVFTLDLNKDFKNSHIADIYNVPFENTN